MKRFFILLSALLGLSLVTSTSLAQEKITVRPGDNLWTLAEKNIGSGFAWIRLWAWNTPVVGQNPNLIFPDSSLVIPPDSSTWDVQIPLPGFTGTGGWVTEFVFRDSTDRFFVSVGFDSTEGIKFALNAVNFQLQKCCSRARDYIRIDRDSPSGLMLDRDNPGYIYRYSDRSHSFGSNFLVRSVPDGLPSFIPRFINRVSN